MEYFEFPEDLTNFLNDPGIHQVVSLNVSDKQIISRIYANSIVLSCHSDVFKSLILDGEEEIFLGELRLSSYTKQAVKLSIEFMYGNRFAVSEAAPYCLLQMHKFAKVWSIASLQRACLDRVINDLFDDPTTVFTYYKARRKLDWSKEEIMEQLLESIEHNADFLIEAIIKGDQRQVKNIDGFLRKELIKSSKTANCGKFLILLLEDRANERFVLNNIKLIPEKTAFTNYSEFLLFRMKFSASETKLDQIGRFYKNNQADHQSQDFNKENKGDPNQEYVKFPLELSSESTVGRTGAKNVKHQTREDNSPLRSKSNHHQLSYHYSNADDNHSNLTNKEVVKENWEDDSFEEHDSQCYHKYDPKGEGLSKGEECIQKRAPRFVGKRPADLLNFTNNEVVKENWEDDSFEEYDSQCHSESVDGREGVSTVREDSPDLRNCTERERDFFLRFSHNNSLEKILSSSLKYNFFTRLEILGLKLSQGTKYSVSKLVSALTPFLEDPKMPSCMLEDFKELALKSIVGTVDRRFLAEKFKEFTEKERMQTTAITLTYSCTEFLKKLMSKGKLRIRMPPFKELIVDFSSDNYVKFFANPPTYENSIIHSYMLRLYDDECSILTYVPILLLKSDEIRRLFETGKSAKYGFVKIVIVLSESIPANDIFYEGVLVNNS